MRIRLSSVSTIYYKAVFAPFWIVLFGAGTLSLWLGPMDDPAPPSLSMKLQFLVAWVLGSTFILWFVRRLSEVWLDDDALIVVSGRSEERIPLAAVEAITETRFWNPKQIKLELRRGMAAQQSVVFIAPWGIQSPFAEHAVVRQLRVALERARSSHTFDARPRS